MKTMASLLLDELRTELLLPKPAKHILIVEDDASFSNCLMQFINDTGCAVEVAETASKAVDMEAKTLPYNLIFLDLNFGTKETGVFALKRIRRMFPTVPIAILSGFISDEFTRLAQDEYHVSVYSKPVDLTKIKALVVSTP